MTATMVFDEAGHGSFLFFKALKEKVKAKETEIIFPGEEKAVL